MKILHTSDWHLGRLLEGVMRLDEQKMVIDEICQIADREDAQMIIIAGDIFDSYNPSAMAEKLFYDSLPILSKDGRRPIVIIAGNHDSPDRLTAPVNVLSHLGVVIQGKPRSICASFGKYNGFEITARGEGFLEIQMGDEKAVILTMPYMSDKRLEEIIEETMDENESQKSYSNKMQEILDKLSENFHDDSVNLIVGHFYVTGGLESQSERSIQLGGSMAVSPSVFPEKAQYIALGHLHRPQTVPGCQKRAFYSGSPLEYSRDEAGFTKAVNIVSVVAGGKAEVTKIPLSCFKPIKIWKAETPEEAIEMCHERCSENSYVFLEIKTDRAIDFSEQKEMKTAKKDILEIRPIFSGEPGSELENDFSQKSMKECFEDFYKKRQQTVPSAELTELFLKMSEEDLDETVDA